MKEYHYRTIKLLKALATRVRYEILFMLVDGEMTVSDMADSLEKRTQNVSQHMRVLKEENLVRFRTKENQVFYRLKNKNIIKALEMLNEFVKRNRG